MKLSARHLTLSYGSRAIIRDVSSRRSLTA